MRTRNLLRLIGDLANAAFVICFAVATLKLWGVALSQLAAAGGMPPLSIDGALGLLSGAGLGTVVHWILAWVSAVGAVGCAWMTVLGTRWLYHWLLRASSG
jgi:hypothetical protein